MNTDDGSVVIAPWDTLEGACLGRTLLAAGVDPAQEAKDDTRAFVLALSRHTGSTDPAVSLQGFVRQSLPVLIVGDSLDPSPSELTASFGAVGMVSWHRTSTEIVRAVKTVAAGRGLPQSPLTHRDDVCARLTERERDVMALIAQGRHDLEIADELGISTHTVRTYVQSSLTKLGASHRHSAAAAVRNSSLMTAHIDALSHDQQVETAVHR